MTESISPLTANEWALIKVLWRRGRSTVREIHDEVHSDTGWAYTTVKTLLERMEAKGLLSVEKVGPVKRFAARKRRRDLVPRAVASFLDQVLDGSLEPLVPYIARTRGLSEDDVRELRRILEED